ncbi:DeoR/GlpR family DNA-binding transcription regulator [Paenibacillus alkalitolerans]|uniref:DeoR/GlpR family DNA-binding transcription regulator n=1 Tax=Paenibacillus alkalitolerans TaxID=2799335 RepID=UPI0018F289CA|nr:DeoR/GlpR family DNA-binding transcription regulator [Paenibacillus alkalitolerans]
MLAVQRHELILKQLEQDRSVKVSELSELLGVTEKTVREDLEKLEEKGLLKRIHGGAVSIAEGEDALLPIQVPNTKYPGEKKDIARRAVEYIEKDDIIALDGGSTTLEIARLLPNSRITVITNDIFIIGELARKELVRLVVPGGYREKNLLAGAEAVDFIRRCNIHKAFVSATGIHIDFGLTVFTGALVDMKRALIESAVKSYCVADRSKFGKSALITFAELHEMEAIITDGSLDPDEALQYVSKGIRLDYGGERL